MVLIFGFGPGEAKDLGESVDASSASPIASERGHPIVDRQTPGSIAAVAQLLDAPAPFLMAHGFGLVGGEWTIAAAFAGFSDPPPAAVHCLGKRSSCVRDDDRRMSCAEIEVTKRLRSDGWRGGWINTYGGDPPRRWAAWTVTPGELARLLPRGREALATWLRAHERDSAGIPDVVMVRDSEVLAIECKRSGQDGSFKDIVRNTQTAWARQVIGPESILRPDEFVVLWWTRSPAPIEPPAVLPGAEPTAKYPEGRPAGVVTSKVARSPAPTTQPWAPAEPGDVVPQPTSQQVRMARDVVVTVGWTRADAAGHPWRPNGRRAPDGTYIPCEMCHARTNPARWPLFFRAGEATGHVRWTCSTCKKKYADRAGTAVVIVDIPPD